MNISSRGQRLLAQTVFTSADDVKFTHPFSDALEVSNWRPSAKHCFSLQAPRLSPAFLPPLFRRWATLLNLFHSKWRGFGAALLVRLVEALLDNASSTLGETVNADNDGRSSCGGGNGNGAGGGGRGGGGGGLERQAAFIETWVNHLLSRRWHLRTSDVSMPGPILTTQAPSYYV